MTFFFTENITRIAEALGITQEYTQGNKCSHMFGSDMLGKGRIPS
jgi:hypothetical protein